LHVETTLFESWSTFLFFFTDKIHFHSIVIVELCILDNRLWTGNQTAVLKLNRTDGRYSIIITIEYIQKNLYFIIFDNYLNHIL